MNDEIEMTAPTIGTDRFTAELLAELRHVGDPVADDLASAFLESVNGSAKDLMARMIDRGATSDEDLVGLKEFVAERPALPDWAEISLIERGQALFSEFAPQAMLGLFTAVLPASYAAAHGADLLAATGRLVSDSTGQPLTDARRRYIETGQFVLDVMAPGGLADQAAGSRDIRHVRLMHGVVRELHEHHRAEMGLDDLPPEAGLPANQEDMLGLALVLGVVSLDSLRNLGIGISDRDADAFVHTWCVVGHLLGVRDDLLPLNRADAEIVWGRIRDHTYGPSVGGTELAAAAVGVLAELIPLRGFERFGATAMRHHDNEVGDILRLPPKDWTRVVFLPAQFFDRVTSRWLAHSPIGKRVAGFIGRRTMRELLATERHGAQRTQFEIPAELADQFRIGGLDVRGKVGGLRDRLPNRS